MFFDMPFVFKLDTFLLPMYSQHTQSFAKNEEESILGKNFEFLAFNVFQNNGLFSHVILKQIQPTVRNSMWELIAY